MLVVDEGTENVLELAATGQFQVDDDGADDNDNESYTTDEDDVNEVQVEKSQRRDMIAYATRWTKELINDPTAARVVRDHNADQSENALATKYDASRKLVQRGFGRRSRHDLKMGMSNAAAFRIPIAELFRDEGSDKQHPSWVLERLAEMDANMYRLDMPTESDVRKVLQRCIRWKMKALKANTPEPDYVELMRSVNDPIDSTYSQFIDAEIERDPLQSPKSFLVSWPSRLFPYKLSNECIRLIFHIKKN